MSEITQYAKDAVQQIKALSAAIGIERILDTFQMECKVQAAIDTALREKGQWLNTDDNIVTLLKNGTHEVVIFMEGGMGCCESVNCDSKKIIAAAYGMPNAGDAIAQCAQNMKLGRSPFKEKL